MASKVKRNIYQTIADVQNITKPKLSSTHQKTKNSDSDKIVNISTNTIHQSGLKNSFLSSLNNVHSKFNFSQSELKKTVITNQINRFKVHHKLSPFKGRVTSIAWHPKYSKIFVVGTKVGELTLHSMNESADYVCPGIGAGGSIVGLKFDLDDPCTVYTASITGNVRQEDLHGKNSKTLMSTLTWENWFACLDVCYNRNILLSGDCKGFGYLIATSGEKIWNKKYKLHGSKITHCEFNQHNQNIFVTSSTDHYMKLWDLRMITNQHLPKSSSKLQPLHQYHHEKAVNSAYFSPSNGMSLLTTDQHSQLRVYSSPLWDETLIIKHPHRQFQHITPMKANWHTLEDIFIVGRYPDNDVFELDTRTIDFYDGSNGKVLHRIHSPTENIVSLNAMNISGDILASAAGYNVVFLKDRNVLNGVSCHHKSDNEDDDSPDDTPTKPFTVPRKKTKPLPKDKLVSTKKLHKKSV